nr:AAA family ATPase [Kineosporia babensis]
MTGATGSGRTRVLGELAEAMRTQGWRVTELRPSADDARDQLAVARALGADLTPGELGDSALVEALARSWTGSSGEPHLVCIDDLDRLDAFSLRAVAAACRRTSARVAMTTISEQGLVDGLPEAHFHQLAGWPPAQIHDVIRRTAAQGPIPEVLDRLTLLADGNPGAAQALTQSQSPAQLLGFEPMLPVGFGVPLKVRFTSRINPELRPAAMLLACGSGTPPAVLERAGAELGVRDTQLDALEQAGLAENRRGGLRLRPAGLGFALEAVSSTGERRRTHTALARAFTGTDQGRALWHRAQAAGEPDTGLADHLETLGESSPRMGGWSMTSLLLQRSSELTADTGERGRRLALAAEAAWLEGTPARALRLLAEAEDLSADLDLKLRVAYVRGSIELAAGAEDRALRVMTDAVPAALERLPLFESTALLMRACDAAVAAGDVVAAVSLGRQAQGRLADAGDAAASVRLQLVAGTAKVLAEDLDAGLALVEDALAACSEQRDQSHSLVGIRASLIAGDTGALVWYADQAADRLRESGNRGMMPFVTARRALADVLLGRLRSAVDITVSGIEESALLGQENARAEHLAVRALAHARAGEALEAGKAAELALRLACDYGLAWPGLGRSRSGRWANSNWEPGTRSGHWSASPCCGTETGTSVIR